MSTPHPKTPTAVLVFHDDWFKWRAEWLRPNGLRRWVYATTRKRVLRKADEAMAQEAGRE